MAVIVTCEICGGTGGITDFQLPQVVSQFSSLFSFLPDGGAEFDVCGKCWLELSWFLEKVWLTGKARDWKATLDQDSDNRVSRAVAEVNQRNIVLARQCDEMQAQLETLNLQETV